MTVCAVTICYPQILEFLPRLNVFRIEWHGRLNAHRHDQLQMARLQENAQQIMAEVRSFDVGRLRALATTVYGSSKRVEWLVDELAADFTLPKVDKHEKHQHKHQKHERLLEKPISKAVVHNSENSPNDRCDGKLLIVNAETDNATKLDFRFEALPRVDADQFDILWYKDNEPIRPDVDPRITVQRDPRAGQVVVNIANCTEADAGKYWCEIRDDSCPMQRSSPGESHWLCVVTSL